MGSIDNLGQELLPGKTALQWLVGTPGLIVQGSLWP
jgi:hypothetical protein